MANVDMTGRVCLVTGATAGIGLATARALAAMNATLIVHGRDAVKARATAESLRAAIGDEQVDWVIGDFASLADVRKLAAELHERTDHLHVLVNNAGAMFPAFRTSVDGFELTMAVNHLAPFLLTNLLLDILKASAPARVVNVSSGAHRRFPLNFGDLESRNDYEVWAVYSRSKLMNILFTRELARRLAGTAVTVNALSPGLVHTEFGVKDGMGPEQQELMNRGDAPEHGARTSIYLATSAEVEGATGGYHSNAAPAEVADIAKDESMDARLWEISAKMVGL